MQARRVAVVAIALVVATVALVLGWPRHWLTIRQDDQLLAVYPGGKATQFSLRWRHSVEEEDWIETFKIVNSAVQIASTRFKTFGAGVPADAGTRTTLEHGWVVMTGINRDVDPLTVQAAAAEQYRFRYEDGPWRRLSQGPAAPILVFAAETAPLIELWPTRLATVWRDVRD